MGTAPKLVGTTSQLVGTTIFELVGAILPLVGTNLQSLGAILQLVDITLQSLGTLNHLLFQVNGQQTSKQASRQQAYTAHAGMASARWSNATSCFYVSQQAEVKSSETQRDGKS